MNIKVTKTNHAKTNCLYTEMFVLMARDYESIFPVYDATLLQDADSAITECGLWEWLATFESCTHPNLDKITDKMKHKGHSGASFTWCMQNMKLVAKLGWDKYREYIVSVRLKETSFDGVVQMFATSSDPEKRKQAEAMQQFKKGELSYAEMRSLCG